LSVIFWGLFALVAKELSPAVAIPGAIGMTCGAALLTILGYTGAALGGTTG